MSLKCPQGSGRIMMSNNRLHHTMNNSNTVNNNNNSNSSININNNNNLISSIGMNNNNNRNMTTLNNIERLLDDSTATFRHKKTLQNIIGIVKLNELLDEYRQIVRSLQNSCNCKKNKIILDQITSLEKRYQDYSSTLNDNKCLNIETGNSIGQISCPMSPVNVGTNQNKVFLAQKLVNQTGKAIAYTAATSANTSKSPALNFTVFNQSLKSNSQNRQSIDDLSNKHHSNMANNSSNNNTFFSRNNGTKYINYSFNPPTNDKITVLEEQIEDEPEEEYDIAEYIILSEMLEREKGKFIRDQDKKHEYINVIRNISTKDTLCYECNVGGKCGFLTRERNQMIFHISKHFENENHSSEEDEDEDSKEDVDISIIPVNPEDILHDEKASPLSYKQNPEVNEKYLAQQLKMQLMALQQEQDNEQNSSSEQTGQKKLIYCTWPGCNFNCDQNYKLRTHIRQVHQKLRPYLCDWPGCFGAYKTRSNLASHRMVHTGERPFICDYPDCGAKFARKYDCERHRRIHCEKMYACEWPGCGKRLCDPYNLERHMMVHKGELPYRCPIGKCIRGFRELRYLRDHMVNAHQCLPDTVQLKLAYIKNSPNNETESDKSGEDNDVEETSIVKKLLVSGTNSSTITASPVLHQAASSQPSNIPLNTKKNVPIVSPKQGTKRQLSAINNKATTSKNVATLDQELHDDETKDDEFQTTTTDDNNNVQSVQIKQEIDEEPQSKTPVKQQQQQQQQQKTQEHDSKSSSKDENCEKVKKIDTAETKKEEPKPVIVTAMSTRRSKRVRNK